jgi:DNA-binding MarR family transcriptional regulator
MPDSDSDGRDLQPIADIDSAIHAPARLMVLAILSVVESADFTFLLRQTGLTRGNLSTHLSKLEAACYIAVKKEFVDGIPRTLIRLTDTGRSALQTYRTNMKWVIDELLGPN